MDVVSLNLQKTQGSPFHQTMEVSATHTSGPCGQEDVCPE